MPASMSQFMPFLIAAVVILAVLRRLRRSFGRQPLRPRRMMLRMTLLVVLACSLAPLALRSAPFLAAELIGAALGIGLSLWAAQRTRLEMHDGRLHYVPHTYAGVVVSLLFLGRLVYRLVQVYAGGPAAPGAASPDIAHAYAPASMIRSPLTVAVFFVLAGYYLGLYGALLLRSRTTAPS
jgi:hypothetical protein